MNQSDNNNYFERVWALVRKVPVGNVTTYGALAEALSLRAGARMVGWALNGCPPDVPAHRVVNRLGMLSGKVHFGGNETMAQLLRSEGVEVDEDRIVNFKNILWQPPFNPIS